MNKIVYLSLTILLMVSIASSTEFSGDITVSFFNDIKNTSTGVSGMVFPTKFRYDRMSLGFDFGIEFVERFMSKRYDNITVLDTLDEYTYDYYIKQYKDYSDFLFIPLGLTFRYDFGDPGDLGRIYPAIFIGAGMILNMEQKSKRLYIDYYFPDQSIYSPYPYESGGDSKGTVDFYIKPKVSVYYNRAYISYEHHINTHYMMGSISCGYIFTL